MGVIGDTLTWPRRFAGRARCGRSTRRLAECLLSLSLLAALSLVGRPTVQVSAGGAPPAAGLGPLPTDLIIVAMRSDGTIVRLDAAGSAGWRARPWQGLRHPSFATLTVAPDGRIFYVLDMDGTVWRSTDGGLHWRQRGQFPGSSVRALIIAPGQAGVVYAATRQGLFCTTDGGLLWHPLQQSLFPRSDVTSLIIDPIQGNNLWAAISVAGPQGFNGVAHSTDGGHTWTQAAVPAGIQTLVLAPGRHRLLYAATIQGLYRSTDAGQHWRFVRTQWHPSPLVPAAFLTYMTDVRVLVPGAWSAHALYAALNFGPVYYSRDGGKTWVPGHWMWRNGVDEGAWVGSIVADHRDPRVAFAFSSDGIYETRDSGITWQLWPSRAQPLSILAVYVAA